MALIRELIGDPLFYLFKRYGEVGIRWIERRSGPDSRWLGTVEQLFRRAAYVVVAVWPISGRLWPGRRRFPATPSTSLGPRRITLIYYLRDLLADPLRDIASFISRYQWYLTPVTFLLVAVSLWRQGGAVEGRSRRSTSCRVAAPAQLEDEATARAVTTGPEHPFDSRRLSPP